MRLLQGGRCGSFGEAERPCIEDSTSGNGRDLSLLHYVVIVPGSHRPSCAMVPRVKRLVRESNSNIHLVAKLIRSGPPSAVGTEIMVPTKP